MSLVCRSDTVAEENRCGEPGQDMADVGSEGSSTLRWQKAEATLKEDPEVEKLAGVVDVPGKKLENNSGS